MTPPSTHRPPSLIAGALEWVALPHLGIDKVVARVDTGAKASSLHAAHITPFEKDGKPWVRFVTHPERRKKQPEITCEAPLLETRRIKSSNGVAKERYVISTWVCVGGYTWPIDLTLAERERMEYRMLFGRTALGRSFLVNPASIYLQGEPRPEGALKLQTKRYKAEASHV